MTKYGGVIGPGRTASLVCTCHVLPWSTAPCVCPDVHRNTAARMESTGVAFYVLQNWPVHFAIDLVTDRSCTVMNWHCFSRICTGQPGRIHVSETTQGKPGESICQRQPKIRGAFSTALCDGVHGGLQRQQQGEDLCLELGMCPHPTLAAL
eukprot:scaffold18522_cov24-Tisochrysis_lutea.AAC.1